MKRAILIVRTSTIRQEIESQKKELIEWALLDGLKESELLVIGDAGASAIKLDDLYLKNINNVKEQIAINKDIKCIYAWAIDRIGRQEELLMNFKNYCVEHKVQIKVKNPSLTLLNEDNTVNNGVELAFNLFATMAKQEMEQKKARFKRAKERNGEKGKWNGGNELRFGYTIDANNFIIPDSEESKVVNEIFKLYATGKYSMQKLADELNNRGWRHRGKSYKLDFVARVLADTIYIGYKDKNKYAKSYTPIIEGELWEKVAKIRENQLKFSTTTKETKTIHFATKILKCKTCGNNYYADFDKYSCYKKRFPKRFADKCEAEPLTIKIEIMDKILWDVASVLHSDYLISVDEGKVEELIKEKNILNEKIAASNDRLNRSITALERFKQLWVWGDISEKEYKTKKAEVLAKHTAILAEIERLNNELNDIEQLIYDVQNPNPLRVLDIIDNVDRIDNTAKCKEIINQHIKEAYLDKVVFNGRKCTAITIVDRKDRKHKFIYDAIAKKTATQYKKDVHYLFMYNEAKKEIQPYRYLAERYEAISPFRSVVDPAEVQKKR